MRLPLGEFGVNAFGNVCKPKPAALLGQPRMKHDLKQQIAELRTQLLRLAALDGVGHLVGFLNGEWRNAGESLRLIPRTAALRIAQSRHQRKQRLETLAGPAHSVPASSSRSAARIPAVAPQMLWPP